MIGQLCVELVCYNWPSPAKRVAHLTDLQPFLLPVVAAQPFDLTDHKNLTTSAECKFIFVRSEQQAVFVLVFLYLRILYLLYFYAISYGP